MIQQAVLATSWARLIFSFFHRLGPLGLLLLGTLDSSFLFLPFGNDLLLIALVSSSREAWSWALDIAMATAGSAAGVLIVDVLMRKAGERGLARFVKPKRVEKLKVKMEHNAGWAIFLATLVPPPFPFTPVIMTASALQVSRHKLLGTVCLGRVVRFTLEAVLAIYFGRTIVRWVNSKVVEYLVYIFLAIAVVGSVISIRKWLQTPGNNESQDK